MEISRTGNIKNVVVTDVADKILPQNKARRGVIIQNQTVGKTIQCNNGQGGAVGFVIPGGTAFLSEIAITEDIWARNITDATKVNLCVVEILGFDAFETAVLNLLEQIEFNTRRGN